MTKFDFEKITNECAKVADKAYQEITTKIIEEGYKYAVVSNGKDVDYLYDICGNAYIKFNDCRSSFYKQYKKYCLDHDMGDPSGMFRDYPAYGHQELKVNMAIVTAVYNFLKQTYNINANVFHYID